MINIHLYVTINLLSFWEILILIYYANSNAEINNFLDILPTCVTNTSHTIIDNISCSWDLVDTVSGNILTSVSDHFSQFLILKKMEKTNSLGMKEVRDWSKFNPYLFLRKVSSSNWNDTLQLQQTDVNKSFDNFYNSVNNLLEESAPLRKLSNPCNLWMTRGILCSIKTCDLLYRKFLSSKDLDHKAFYQERSRSQSFLSGKIQITKLSIRKDCITIVSLCRASKTDYYRKYFQENSNSIRNVWKGINTLISGKTYSQPPGGSMVTDPKVIVLILIYYANSNAEINNFLDILPTCVTNTSHTIIDNISCSWDLVDTVSGNILTSVSDHFSQFLILKKMEKTNSLGMKEVRDWSKFNPYLFLRKVSSSNWNDTLQLQQTDVNKSFDNFYNSVNNLLEESAPLRKLSNPCNLWMTRGILCSIKTCDLLYRKFLSSKDLDHKAFYQERSRSQSFLSGKIQITKLSIRKDCITIVSLCRASKTDYYRKYFQENSNSIRNVWKGINTLISGKTYSQPPGGSMVTDPKVIVNTFNSFFASVAEKIRSKIPKTLKTFSHYLKNSNPNTIFLSPTTKDEVLKCSYPDNLKVAKVIPIHKKGTKLLCNNYRPISLLPNLDNIFEKLIYQRVRNFLLKHNSSFSHRIGFRRKYSTSHAIINMIQTIMDEVDKGCGIFIDLQKAFDTVKPQNSIENLSHYGGERLFQSNSIKHLGILLDSNLTWKPQIYSFGTKSIRHRDVLSWQFCHDKCPSIKLLDLTENEPKSTLKKH
ncbi:uncharacterized protein LOC130623135 [Hydractinia symbiolongicarpus]|uniref:uncharacterized protein LOC130623135 n=1 Tax=Hydractinia symbiolongicarpus TaxID=13093 RepID=UPI00254EF822|nr:uncharacterized protein LOC130623135 [Hydractinia symbiolongicarpus]